MNAYLARHNRRPRFILRQQKLAQSTTRSGPQKADIIGNLHERHCDHVQRAVCLDDGVVCGKCLELGADDERVWDCVTNVIWRGGDTWNTLFGAVWNGSPVNLATSAAIATSKPFLVLRP